MSEQEQAGRGEELTQKERDHWFDYGRAAGFKEHAQLCEKRGWLKDASPLSAVERELVEALRGAHVDLTLTDPDDRVRERRIADALQAWYEAAKLRADGGGERIQGLDEDGFDPGDVEAPSSIDPRWVELWDEINNYAQACGGDTSDATVSNLRMNAVSRVERALEAMRAPAAAKPDERGVVAEIAAERERQKSVEGWTVEHDDEHDGGDLTAAAAAYALHAANELSPYQQGDAAGSPPPECWPFQTSWWKPRGARRDLIRAAALIVAEIERLDRAAASARESANKNTPHHTTDEALAPDMRQGADAPATTSAQAVGRARLTSDAGPLTLSDADPCGCKKNELRLPGGCLSRVICLGCGMSGPIAGDVHFAVSAWNTAMRGAREGLSEAERKWLEHHEDLYKGWDRLPMTTSVALAAELRSRRDGVKPVTDEIEWKAPAPTPVTGSATLAERRPYVVPKIEDDGVKPWHAEHDEKTWRAAFKFASYWGGSHPLHEVNGIFNAFRSALAAEKGAAT